MGNMYRIKQENNGGSNNEGHEAQSNRGGSDPQDEDNDKDGEDPDDSETEDEDQGRENQFWNLKQWQDGVVHKVSTYLTQ